MIIELIGMPGAGKSTIVNSLMENAKELNIKKYQDVVREQKLNKTRRIFFIGFVLFHSLKFLPLFIEALKNSQNKSYTFIRLQKLLIMLYNIKMYKGESIIIMDQGVMQLLVSIFGVNSQKKAIPYNKYLALIWKVMGIDNFKLIYIKTQIIIAFERITNRNKPNCEFNKMNPKDRITALIAYSEVLEKLKVDYICNAEAEPKYNAKLISNSLLTS